MNNRIDLRVQRSLQLLETLKRTGANFARREDELNKDLGGRRSVLRRKHRDATTRVETTMATQLTDAEAFFAAAQARIKESYQKRGERIERVRAAFVKNLPKKAEEVRGKWIGDLQLKQVQAERLRDNQLKKAEKTFSEASTRLAEQRSAFADLARDVHKAMIGYRPFTKMLERDPGAAPQADPNPPEAGPMLDELAKRVSSLQGQIKGFRGLFIPRIFSIVNLTGMIVIALAAGVVAAVALGMNPGAYTVAGGIAAALIILAVVLYFTGLKQAQPAANQLTESLAETIHFGLKCGATVNARREADHKNVLDAFNRTVHDIGQKWNQADRVESDFRIRTQRKIEKQAPHAIARNAELFRKRQRRLEPEKKARLDRIREAAEVQKRQLNEKNETETNALNTEETQRWSDLAAAWEKESTVIFDAIAEMEAFTHESFPPWSDAVIEGWTPPRTFMPSARLGSLELDLTSDPDGMPKDARLVMPESPNVSIPLSLTFPDHGSILFEIPNSGDEAVGGALNNIILRLLSTTPPGKITFTIFDPVGLGKDFAGFMHLADYEESLINRRIWTQRDQLEDRLSELNEHIEKVIQMYLRNEYATITEYNEQAGSVAEKYHFLVISDFPNAFSETAAKRLQSIAVSGPRCGVFTFIHWDPRQALPDGFVPDELRKNSIRIYLENGQYVIDPAQMKAGAELVFDAPPTSDLAAALVHKIGKASIDSNRVEVPFSQIAPKPEDLWKNDTTNELKIPIGRTGATKLQYLSIGKGTRQHALFAGKTGSGKSTLFHVIITNLALACSPEQVEFYLIDFKKGVEFKAYATARLPHARVIAIESDREFGLSVLQRVDEELKRRGDMFRKLGVQDIAGYKRAGGTEPVPRSLLMIDEFQEFFVEDDTIAQTASVLFDRIVRQGRAFGIHVLLGSQTLGGAFTLARATMGQMVIRVALQCNEADAYLIMDENNSAPRLLSRPGEGIYNDSAGAVEGNSPFQVVWLSDEDRDKQLERVHELAVQSGKRPAIPIVFEGNAPSDITENDPLALALETVPTAPPLGGRAWLGAPNSIKGPTEAFFQRQSGNHLLIVGQREEAALSMLGVAMISLAAQYPIGTAKFILLHASAPGSSDDLFIEKIASSIPHGVTIGRGQDIASAVNEIGEELKARTGGGEGAAAGPTVFLFVLGLQKFKKLRQEDEFSFSTGDDDGGANPATQFGDLIREGAPLGLHILATVDTYNSVNRFISRKALSEFEMRVVFQMSANDSASLVDSAKAANLGLHRALLHNEAQGSDETFRPYSPPENAWIEEAAAKLKKRLPAAVESEPVG